MLPGSFYGRKKATSSHTGPEEFKSSSGQTDDNRNLEQSSSKRGLEDTVSSALEVSGSSQKKMKGSKGSPNKENIRPKRNRTENKKYADFYLMGSSSVEQEKLKNSWVDTSNEHLHLEESVSVVASPVQELANESLNLSIDLESLMNDSTVARHMELLEDMDCSFTSVTLPAITQSSADPISIQYSTSDQNHQYATLDPEQIHDGGSSSSNDMVVLAYATNDINSYIQCETEINNQNRVEENERTDIAEPMAEHEILPNKRKIAKKGSADPNTWKRNAKALKRMKGEGRVLKKSSCNCCQSKLNEDQRQALFDGFWEVDWSRKRDFVLSNTEVAPTARKTNGEKESRRANSIKYYLPDKCVRIRVCKEYFLTTLGVGAMFIRGTMKASSSSAFSAVHGNTKRAPSNKTPNSIKENAMSFLRKLPTMPSHYCRKDSNLMYLEPGHTIPKLYHMYQEEAVKEAIKPVSEKIFRQIFVDMNLSIFNPRKDQCDVCVSFREGHLSLDDHNGHLSDKDRARHFKDLDKFLAGQSQGTLNVATMDLQQVLLCPKSLSSAVYYKRKLCVHNFTVYDLTSKEGYCYVWHEGEGGLDSDEFASLVVEYLRQLPDSVETAILWSDGCTYQNRNSTLASAIMFFLRSNEKPSLTEVHQKYLTKGHTQMEVDSVHAAIETASSKIEVVTPQEWTTVMKVARAKKPYHVRTLDHTFWKKYPSLVSTIRPGKGPGDPVVTDIKHLVYTKDGIFYSLCHGSPVYPLPIRSKRVSNKTEEVQQKYSKKLPIAPSKIDDLKELCRTIIPKEHHSFFETLY